MCLLSVPEETKKVRGLCPRVQTPSRSMSRASSSPIPPHGTARHSTAGCITAAWTPTFQSSECPASEKAGKKETRRRTVFLPFSFNASGNGKPQRHAPGPGMQDEKTNKLKSTSEVTLQDINLEVYWQRGKRPGLVHGRDTLAEHPPAGNRLQTGGRWEGGKEQQATTTHPRRGSLRLILVYLKVCILWSK